MMWIFIALFWLGWAMIVYTYLLFPLLLALYARVFGRRRDSVQDTPTDDLPRVAMVIAAYNEEGAIAVKLANTWSLDYPPDRLDVFIGSDGSTDATNALLGACRDPRLHCFLFPERRGKISVLNDVVQRVDADIIVMSGASTIYDPAAIRNLVRHFQDPRVGCVTGEIQQQGDVSGEGAYLRYERWLKRQEGRLGYVMGCVGAIFAIRRDLYHPLPASTIVEDFVVCMRVIEEGYLVRSEPRAHAFDPPCPTTRGEMERKVRMGAGAFQALGLTRSLLHPRYGTCAFIYLGHKVFRWFVPFFFLAALGSDIVLAFSSGLYRWLLALQACGALIAIWTYNAPPGTKSPMWTRPFSYFYLMNYALFCGFLRFLFKTQKVTWNRAQSLVGAPVPASAAVHGAAESPAAHPASPEAITHRASGQ